MAGWTWTGRWWPDDEGATFAGARFSDVQPCLPPAPHTHPPTHTSTCTRHAAVQSSRDQRPQRPSASTCTRSYFRTLESLSPYNAHDTRCKYGMHDTTYRVRQAISKAHERTILPSARKLCPGLLVVPLCSKRPILWCWAARFRSAVNRSPLPRVRLTRHPTPRARAPLLRNASHTDGPAFALAADAPEDPEALLAAARVLSPAHICTGIGLR